MEWTLPPPEVTTYYIRYWFPASVNIFLSHAFPLCIHLECFRLQGFFLNAPYIDFLPQWTNIFNLTKQCSTNLRYNVNYLDNKTIHEKGNSNMLDISENSTMWKPWYFSLPETTKSQFTMINYETAKTLLKQQNTSINSEIMAVKLVDINLLLKSYTPFPNSTKIPIIFHVV